MQSATISYQKFPYARLLAREVPEWLSAAVDADGPSRTSQIHLYSAANHANSIMAARRARRGDRPCRIDGRRGARNQRLSPRGTGVRIQMGLPTIVASKKSSGR